MFTASKIIWWIAEPSNLFLLVLCGSVILLWTRWRRVGRGLLLCCAIFAALISVVPVGSWMIAPLEDRFPQQDTLPPDVVGIISLGGAVNQFMTEARGQPALSDGAERLTEFVKLARLYPDKKLVYSGGSGQLLRQDVKETLVARRFLEDMGIDTSRVRFEDSSRNTHENAVNSFKAIAPKPGEKWVLITSAMHMPRAVGCFRQAGWIIVPYPVDYTTYDDGTVSISVSFLHGIANLSRGLREWIGLIAYWLLDRTDEVFPAPVR